MYTSCVRFSKTMYNTKFISKVGLFSHKQGVDNIFFYLFVLTNNVYFIFI